MTKRIYKKIAVVFMLYCLVSLLLGMASPYTMSIIMGGGVDNNKCIVAVVIAVYVAYYSSMFFTWFYYDSILFNNDRTIYMAMLVSIIPFFGIIVYFWRTRGGMQFILSVVLFMVALFVLYLFESYGGWLSLGVKPA